MTVQETVKLSDGTEAIIRPMKTGDLEKSLAFFTALPEEDRACLRRDVTKLNVIQQRIREMQDGVVKRLVALVDDEIVADAAIELASYGWEHHIGEVRLIVARPYQRKGLGMLMARALYNLAAGAGIEELVVKMMRSQTAARHIFWRLGFCDEVV
ncbi:MAG: GNAT family N-acetyltransferase, partial [bacterium]|nr:GNAT family N-acetyltransferase [bacterium]